MEKEITEAQSFFAVKIFPYLDEIYNYALLVTNDDRSAESLLLNTCKKAAWFSKYLSSETDTRIWLLRILMKIEENAEPIIAEVNNTPQTEQLIDLSKFERDCIEREGKYATAQHIRETVSKLPHTLRKVLILIDFLKFDFKQTADLIDIPAGVVLTRLFDARKQLLIDLTSALSTLSLTEISGITREDKKEIVSIVDEHIKDDKKLFDQVKLEYEIETQQYVKGLFQKYLISQPVRPIIQEKIIKRFAPQLKDKITKNNLSGNRGFVVIATIVMLILTAVLIFINGPGIVNPGELAAKQNGEDNILIQLEHNYNSFIEHRFDSLIVGNNAETMNKYLSEFSTGNNPAVLRLSGWYPSNFFITSFNDIDLINLIYKNDRGTKLYTCRIPLDLVEKDNSFKLTDDLLEYLKSENCFVTRTGDVTYLLKIMNGNILGVAGKDLDKGVIASVCNQKFQ